MNAIKFWSVFVIGVAAGAGVALIYAPQSGEETRKQLKDKFDDASDYVKDTASDLGARAGKAYSKGKSTWVRARIWRQTTSARARMLSAAQPMTCLRQAKRLPNASRHPFSRHV